MLEDSEYSPWVKTIFASIKIATFFRGISNYSPFFKYILDEFIFKSKKARAKAHEHSQYSSERVDRRMAREPDHEDLWSKILKKDEEDGGLTREEQVTSLHIPYRPVHWLMYLCR